MERVAISLGALVIALAISAGIIAATGGDVLLAFSALVDGAFGSGDSLSEVLVKACPLMLTGLAVTVAFRTGVWNIGAEGQLLMGALLAAAIGPHLAELPAVLAVPLCLVPAALAGAAWAWIAVELKLRRNVSEIISTIMLNFIALQLVGFLVQGPMMESGGRYPQSDALPLVAWLPRLLPPHRVHAGVLLALLMGVAVWVLLFRSVAGYEMRAAGLSPAAARLAGIAVESRLRLSLLLSGALAGLAGGVELSAITHRLYERFSPGWGFTAIAVALLGSLHPLGVIAAALFFGALDAGSNAMQRQANVSSVLVSVIQAVVILFLAVIEWRRSSSPVS